MRPNSNQHRLLARLLAGSALSALTFTLATGAQAQGAAKADQAAQPQEIVVTAEKRTERLQDVPASVAVVNVSALADQGIVSLQDYAARIPGLSLTASRPGQQQVTLRGITTGPAGAGATTAFYIDEAPIGSVNAYTQGSSDTPDLDPSDLARVEVLKGPQGTLYGAGAMGGLVKYVTVDPNFTTFGGHVSIGGDTVAHGGDGANVRGLINVPIVTDKLALRLSAFDRQDPAYITNVNTNDKVNGTHVRGGRVSLAIKPSDGFELNLSAIRQETSSDGSNVEDVSPVTLAPLYGALEQKRFTSEPIDVALQIFNATAKAQLGNFKLLSSTTYQTVSVSGQADGTFGYGALLGAVFHVPNLGIRTHNNTRTERLSQELRLESSALDNKLDYQVGLYATHENDSNTVPKFDPFSTVTGLPIGLPNIVTAAIESRYTEYSVFANATYHFTSQFDVLVGARYSDDTQNYFQDYKGLLVGAERINVGTEKGSIGTYLFSPQFKFTPDSMAYVRISNGYRPGGPNAVPPPAVYPAPVTFAPDKLVTYEAGYKAELLDHRLTVDAAAFYTNWTDIQIQKSAGGFNFFVNGGTAVSKGAELTLRLMPVHGLVLGLNSAYTDARLTSVAAAAGGVSGDELPFVPKWSGSLTADYRWPLANDWEGVLNGSLNYTGDRISDFSANDPKTVPAFTTVDLRVGVNHGPWSLSLYGKNLSDSRGILTLRTEGLSPAASPFGASIIQPRLVGAELNVKF